MKAPTSDSENGPTSAEIQAEAEAWYSRQLDSLRTRLGPAWTEHGAWVCDYLRQEIRQRLVERGWRPRGS
jgi:hypothetical protein